MPFRVFLASILFGACLFTATRAEANQPAQFIAASAAQASAPTDRTRYELGAVVDVRRASADGVPLLAITPGGAADRLGLQAGDRLRTVNGRRLDNTPKPSSALEDALQEVGVPVERRSYEGVAHEFFGAAAVLHKAREAQDFAGQRLREAFAL